MIRFNTFEEACEICSILALSPGASVFNLWSWSLMALIRTITQHLVFKCTGVQGQVKPYTLCENR